LRSTPLLTREEALLTGIDGGTAAELRDRIDPLAAPLPDMWTAFEAEFFVEWQVADRAPHRGPAGAGEVNSL
jgi:hypothetical protein